MLASNYEFSLIDEHGNSSEFFTHPEYNRYCASQDGDIYSLKTHRMLKQSPDPIYYKIALYKNDKVKKYRSHRFVYESCNNRLLDESEIIDHINQNKLDNRLCNLRVGDYHLNSLNKYNHIEVSEIPTDLIKINNYGTHKFTNFYFSPSVECCYAYYMRYWFCLPFHEHMVDGKSYKRLAITDDENKMTELQLIKLKRLIL